jgi:hypothetical protein
MALVPRGWNQNVNRQERVMTKKAAQLEQVEKLMWHT